MEQGNGGPPGWCIVVGDADFRAGLDAVLRETGTHAVHVTDLSQLPAVWADPAAVLVSESYAPGVGSAMAAGLLGHRPGVAVVADGPPGPATWERAVGCGASAVLSMPADARRLAELVSAAPGAARPPSPLIAVVGGRGGAGASTLATALAVRAVQGGARTALFDVDPHGGGLDLVVGSAGAHRGPRPEVFFAQENRAGEPPEPFAVFQTVVLARQQFALVVADVGRPPLDAAGLVFLLATTTLLVVPAEFRACAAAASVLREVEALSPDVRLVVRGPGPGRLSTRMIEESLGIPLAGYVRTEAGVARGLEVGEPPGRAAGSLRRAAGKLLDDLAPGLAA